MKNQVQNYSLDDKAFYTHQRNGLNENDLNSILMWAKSEKKLIEDFILFNLFDLTSVKARKEYSFKNFGDFKRQLFNSKNSKHAKKDIEKILKENNSKRKSPEIKEALKNNALHKVIRLYIGMVNKQLNKMIEDNKNIVRNLNPKYLTPWNEISLFESDLSRTLGFEIDELTKDLFVIKVFRSEIMNQLVKNGFIYLNEKYIILTSSAGQIRTKKIVFIKESTLNKFTNTLMCGLTIKAINNSEEHGMNINKFLSYLALINSATDPIEGFDIDRAIVIDDFETMVNGEVDYIDKTLESETKKVKNEKTGEIEEVVEEFWQLADKPIRQKMDVPITHSDGCGWVLPSVKSKNFMLRLPWMKGLLTPVDFLKYCKLHNDGNYKITDIYNKEWDLKADNIQYVFSKSQFKMWKYYDSWDTYKKNFKDNNCHANYCNEEDDTFENKRFNYQMLQTLTNIKPKEIDILIKPTVDLLKDAYVNKDTMLMLLGATKSNKTYLQKALELYPELINDKHVKEDLSDIINSKRKEAKYAKIELDCTYTFLIPDVFAWMQYSISGIKNPEGLLQDQQVSCKLYKKEKKLLVERSPHLFLEHGIRNNVYSKKNESWFCTDGIYTSCHDLISKLLQFDNDGDRALVVADKTLITVAQRNMKGIVPLYYKMGKAKSQEINSENIYQSLKMAFKYGNIGKYSNKLTTLWNIDGEKDLDLMKIICALNNFSIDAAKTLEMPRVSKELTQKINEFDKLPLPYFFQFAKDKDPAILAPQNNSTVNQVCKKIEDIKIPTTGEGKNKKYDFSGIGKFRSAMLMHNPKIKTRMDITHKYDEINEKKNKYFMKAKSHGKEKKEVSTAVYTQIKKDLYEPFKNEVNIIDFVDILIKHVYSKHRTCKKSFLFNCFGSVIIENLKNNIKKPLEDGFIQCSCCGTRVKKESNRQKMCRVCGDKANGEKTRLRMKLSREQKKLAV